VHFVRAFNAWGDIFAGALVVECELREDLLMFEALAALGSGLDKEAEGFGEIGGRLWFTTGNERRSLAPGENGSL
jgi:hypothetical protein